MANFEHGSKNDQFEPKHRTKLLKLVWKSSNLNVEQIENYQNPHQF